jgi:DNA-binding HxlR family transcriptional regulator
MTLSERTYGQYCPIAAGLDLVGDRWTLLICRELAQGDRRYTDLCRALDGIAPNLLSDRLRMLQEAGLVTTAELPPAARSVYRLTATRPRSSPCCFDIRSASATRR